MMTPQKPTALPSVPNLFSGSGMETPVIAKRAPKIARSCEDLRHHGIELPGVRGNRPSLKLVEKHGFRLVVPGIVKDNQKGLGTGWLPESWKKYARVASLHLSDGRQYYVYIAELTDDVFYALVLTASYSTPAEVEKQRNDIALSHLMLADFLERDYAPFLAAKIHSHMPILNFVQEIPGLVHFLFVDRCKGISVVPSISALHGCSFLARSVSGDLREQVNDMVEPHTTEQMRKLIFELVQRAYDHLSMGCSTMMLRTRGFQMSYRLWFEFDGEPRTFDEMIADTDYKNIPQPWTISPEFYDAIINSGRVSSCYELFTIYIGTIPVGVVPRKDGQLMEFLSGMLDPDKDKRRR